MLEDWLCWLWTALWGWLLRVSLFKVWTYSSWLHVCSVPWLTSWLTYPLHIPYIDFETLSYSNPAISNNPFFKLSKFQTLLLHKRERYLTALNNTAYNTMGWLCCKCGYKNVGLGDEGRPCTNHQCHGSHTCCWQCGIGVENPNDFGGAVLKGSANTDAKEGKWRRRCILL